MDELDKLLSYSFEEIKQNGDLIIKLLQLSQNFLHLSHTECEKQHRSYFEKLKTIKNIPMENKVNLLDRKYILKPGKSLYYNHNHFFNEGEASKENTLTDQIAANAIKRFPALVGAFLNEKERAILEAKAAAKHEITDAENNLADEQFENQIIALIDAEKFDEARELVPKLLIDETREAAEAAIVEGEEKVKAAAGEAEKKIADEAKKVEDKKAEAEKPEAKGKAATKKKKNNAK